MNIQQRRPVALAELVGCLEQEFNSVQVQSIIDDLVANGQRVVEAPTPVVYGFFYDANQNDLAREC